MILAMRPELSIALRNTRTYPFPVSVGAAKNACLEPRGNVWSPPRTRSPARCGAVSRGVAARFDDGADRSPVISAGVEPDRPDQADAVEDLGRRTPVLPTSRPVDERPLGHACSDVWTGL